MERHNRFFSTRGVKNCVEVNAVYRSRYYSVQSFRPVWDAYICMGSSNLRVSFPEFKLIRGIIDYGKGKSAAGMGIQIFVAGILNNDNFASEP